MAWTGRIKVFFADYQSYLSGEVDLNTYEAVEAPHRRLSYYAFFAFVVLAGFPVWYFATTPYRAVLPSFNEDTLNRLNVVRAQLVRGSMNNGSDVVWDRTPLYPKYQLQLIFLHMLGAEVSDIGSFAAERFASRVERFSQAVEKDVHLASTGSHLWDFNPDNVAVGHLPLVVGVDTVTALTSEIDRLSAPPAGHDPLLKLALIIPRTTTTSGTEEDQGSIRLVDENGADVNALLIASWGAVMMEPAETSPTSSGQMSWDAVVINVLLTLMGTSKATAAAASSSGSGQNSTAVAGRLEKLPRDYLLYQQKLFVENLHQTAHFVNSLHDLKYKIEDLVISDEVASLARRAAENFFHAFNAYAKQGKIDCLTSAKARILANRAITHPSLLEYLNFPSDQKYGIYIPLYLPLLVPIIFPLAQLLKFLFGYRKWKAARKVVK